MRVEENGVRNVGKEGFRLEMAAGAEIEKRRFMGDGTHSPLPVGIHERAGGIDRDDAFFLGDAIEGARVAVGRKNGNVAGAEGKKVVFKGVFLLVQEDESLFFEGLGRDLVVDRRAQ